MANKKMFSSSTSRGGVRLAKKSKPRYTTPIIPANTINNAGGIAYDTGAEHSLAQLIVTSTFNDNSHINADAQVKEFLRLANIVSPLFLAQCAIYGKEKGMMKDSPMMVLAVLSKRDPALFSKVFNRLVTYEGNLRTFVQIMRSGVTGRKSLGSLPKKLVNNWLTSRGAERLFRGSLGNDPSLSDVIRMTHPNTTDKELRALFAYLVNGKPYSKSNERGYKLKDLPEVVQQFEAFKEDQSNDLPDIDFRMLSNIKLTDTQWKEIAKNAKWGTLLKNIRNFATHNVFNDPKLVKKIAETIADETVIGKVKAMPHQVLQAYDVLSGVATDRFGRTNYVVIPKEILEALDIALDATIQNIPDFNCDIIVCPDVSPSMNKPVTGMRKGASSTVTAEKAAALVAAAIARKNAGKTYIISFSTIATNIPWTRNDTLSSLTRKIQNSKGGGTECSAPICYAVDNKIKANIIYLLSDNESWVLGNTRHMRPDSATATVKAWREFKKLNPDSKLICHDFTPNGSTQVLDTNDVMNVGGFSESHFDIVQTFIENDKNENPWISAIKAIKV